MKLDFFKFETQNQLLAAKNELELFYPHLMITATSSDPCKLAVENSNSLIYDTRISSIIYSKGGIHIDSE